MQSADLPRYERADTPKPSQAPQMMGTTPGPPNAGGPLLTPPCPPRQRRVTGAQRVPDGVPGVRAVSDPKIPLGTPKYPWDPQNLPRTPLGTSKILLGDPRMPPGTPLGTVKKPWDPQNLPGTPNLPLDLPCTPSVTSQVPPKLHSDLPNSAQLSPNLL